MWSIGNVTLADGAALSPMAGVTDMPFRHICRLNGAAYTVTEMISAKALSHNPAREAELRLLSGIERPAALQIFGNEPERMADMAQQYGADFAFIDINMGCPAPKIVRGGQGSALLCQSQLAGRIIACCARRLSQPVTVKMRIGWDADHRNYLDFARMAQDSGAAALCVHGRTREQFYAGTADWQAIAEIKRAVRIPVLGNGDIWDGPDALRRMAQSGVDGLMVGRGALGNPWIFRRISDALAGRPLYTPDFAQKRQVMLLHCRLQQQVYPARQAVLRMRKHMAWYLKGFRDAAKLRQRVFQMESMAQIEAFVDELEAYSSRRADGV
ncbi:MAG: tRNA dihydrouridine synthase DusB [Eubacteriales bacterium]|nr:tRNA dihydrouridine synthase DusB [Eubacteriales bacterium]